MSGYFFMASAHQFKFTRTLIFVIRLRLAHSKSESGKEVTESRRHGMSILFNQAIQLQSSTLKIFPDDLHNLDPW